MPNYPKVNKLFYEPDTHYCSYNRFRFLPTVIPILDQRKNISWIKTEILERLLTFPESYGGEC